MQQSSGVARRNKFNMASRVVAGKSRFAGGESAPSTPLKPTPPKGPPPPVAPQIPAEGQLTEEHSGEKGLDEGMELFRELLRFMPTANVHTYFNGINKEWNKELILTDTDILQAHRREAQAPDPPPREEMPVPEISKQFNEHFGPSITRFGKGQPKAAPLSQLQSAGVARPIKTSTGTKVGLGMASRVVPEKSRFAGGESALSTPLKPTPPKGPPPPVAPQIPAEGQLTEEHSGEKGLDEGMELFRELLRFMPTANVHTYFNGINKEWNKELILTDTDILQAHRREAQAPDPPPREEMPVPQAHHPQAEARSIETFSAQWNLNITRVKYFFYQLASDEQQYVMSNFRHTSTGQLPEAALRQYIRAFKEGQPLGPSQVTSSNATRTPLAGLKISLGAKGHSSTRAWLKSTTTSSATQQPLKHILPASKEDSVGKQPKLTPKAATGPPASTLMSTPQLPISKPRQPSKPKPGAKATKPCEKDSLGKRRRLTIEAPAGPPPSSLRSTPQLPVSKPRQPSKPQLGAKSTKPCENDSVGKQGELTPKSPGGPPPSALRIKPQHPRSTSRPSATFHANRSPHMSDTLHRAQSK